MRRPTHPDLRLRWRITRAIIELERATEQTVQDATGRLLVSDSELNRHIHQIAREMREIVNHGTDKCREYLWHVDRYASGASDGDA